jgi:hypothetical protein
VSSDIHAELWKVCLAIRNGNAANGDFVPSNLLLHLIQNNGVIWIIRESSGLASANCGFFNKLRRKESTKISTR